MLKETITNVLKCIHHCVIVRLHEFELAVTSVVEVKQPAQEQFLAKVNLPFSLEIGKFDSSGLGIFLYNFI